MKKMVGAEMSCVRLVEFLDSCPQPFTGCVFILSARAQRKRVEDGGYTGRGHLRIV
jgi:hypothetical protein